MGDRTILGSAAGLLLVGGGVVGRESVVWAYGKGLDWLLSSIGAGQVTWVEGVPWLNMAGSLSMVAGGALGLYAIFHRPKPVVSIPDPAQEPASSPIVAEQPKPAPYLSDAVIVDGIGSTFPEFRARFTRNGQSGTFYIEHSFHVGVYGSSWTLPRKIAVLRRSRFASGEMISFPLVSPGMTDDGTRWLFGPAFAADGKPATDRLNPGAHYSRPSDVPFKREHGGALLLHRQHDRRS